MDLADVPIDQVRERIVVSDTAGQVFAGTLQSVIDPHGRLSLAEAETALRAAAAEDVFEGLQEAGRAGSTSAAAGCLGASASAWYWPEHWGSTRRS